MAVAYVVGGEVVRLGEGRVDVLRRVDGGERVGGRLGARNRHTGTGRGHVRCVHSLAADAHL